MNDNLITLEDQRRMLLARLRDRREELLSLPPEKALAQLLEEKQPAALVHSFPEQDLYFLVHDIGLGDALPLLALASDRQREYILDMEGWHRDRLDADQATGWLNAMFLADPDRVVAWLLKEQTELLELLLFRNIQVVIREHDQDPSTFPGDFFTHDDIYYVRILDNPLIAPPEELPPDSAEKLMDDERRGFIYHLLARLADLDHVVYQKVLLEAVSIMPAEVEEEAYRQRNVRMAEKGFLPFDEAIGIYQPVTVEDLDIQPAKTFGLEDEEGAVAAAPHYPVKMLPKGMPFSDALQKIDSALLLQRIQTEFVTLCNQVIAADQQKIQAREALQAMVAKVCGYLNIGLEASVPGDGTGKDNRSEMASVIQRLPLSQVFRFGYGKALDLKWEVARWRKTAWFENANLPLTFWGEQWLGTLGGLLLDKPLYFDNYRTGDRLYREFASLSEIGETEQSLSNIMDMDALLAGMGLQCKNDPRQVLTWQSLLLTLWARSYSGLGEAGEFTALGELAPIPKEAFVSFFKELFAMDEASPASLPARVDKSMKIEFLKWLSGRAEQSPDVVTGKNGSALDALFEHVDEELGGIRPGTIDPRHIHLFRIQ
jgi:hypothetical protein